jgi:uracil-DNA glycosylase
MTPHTQTPLFSPVTESILSPEAGFAEREASLQRCQNQVASCQACPLHETRTQTVFSDGNPQAPLLLIGEGPGQNEDETGIPFVGRAGQLLTRILASVEIHRPNDIYICNIVKCRPPENRKPLPAEMDACRSFLHTQLMLIQPKLVLLAGASAVEGVMRQKLPISKVRGQWLDHPEYPFAKFIPIFHPSYLLRNASGNEGSPKWLTWQDMKAVRQALNDLS